MFWLCSFKLLQYWYKIKWEFIQFIKQWAFASFRFLVEVEATVHQMCVAFCQQSYKNKKRISRQWEVAEME